MRRSERIESLVQLLILLLIGGMAGAASFTHVHDWTMHNSPPGTGDWSGWATAALSALTPPAAGLALPRRSRTPVPVWPPSPTDRPPATPSPHPASPTTSASHPHSRPTSCTPWAKPATPPTHPRPSPTPTAPTTGAACDHRLDAGSHPRD